jgi:hypothetical protein
VVEDDSAEEDDDDTDDSEEDYWIEELCEKAVATCRRKKRGKSKSTYFFQ